MSSYQGGEKIVCLLLMLNLEMILPKPWRLQRKMVLMPSTERESCRVLQCLAVPFEITLSLQHRGHHRTIFS